MFALCIYILLSEYKKTLYMISKALKTMSGNHLEWLCNYLEITDERHKRDVKRKVLQRGVGMGAVSWWEEILRLLAVDVVYPRIASELRINKEHIINSSVVGDRVFRAVANKLSDVNDFRNVDLERVIKTCVSEVVRGCAKEIEREVKRGSKLSLDRKHQRGETNSALTSGITAEPSGGKQIDFQGLRNVSGERFKRILRDIYLVSPLLSISTTNKAVQQYNLFAAYIHHVSKEEVERINSILPKGLSAVLDNTSRTDGVAIQDRTDDMVDHMFPYISERITKANMPELLSSLHSYIYEYQRPRTSKGAGHTRVTLKVQMDFLPPNTTDWSGNFGRNVMFRKTESAENFTTYALGFIALGTLHRWLIEARVSPLTIDPDVFSFEDPSTKFSSLEDLVLYSKIYCSIRRRYHLTAPASSAFNGSALCSAQTADIFTRTRAEHNRCLEQLKWVLDRDWQEVEVENSYETYSMNLSEIIDALKCWLNPILYLSPDYHLEDDDGNPVNLSAGYPYKWLAQVNEDPFSQYKYCSYKQYSSVTEFKEDIEQGGYELGQIIEGLFPVSLEQDIYVRAINVCVEILDIVMEQIVDAINIPYIEKMSQMELAMACVDTEFYTALRDFTRSDAVSLHEHRAAIISKLNETFGAEYSLEFIPYDVYREMFSTLFASRALTTFFRKTESAIDSVYELVHASYQFLLDVDHEAETAMITDPTVIINLRNGLKGILRADDVLDYMVRTGSYQDQYGYVKRSDGSFVTRTFRNQVGYLHNCGMFIISRTRAESAVGYL